jgi:uncharacterized membrane protein YphA (DoxX/SURF4 family)
VQPARETAGNERYIAGFAGVALAHALVVAFIYAIPYIEVIIGPPVLLGLWTRWALLANAALLLVFIISIDNLLEGRRACRD